MSALTTYLADALLNHLLRGTALSVPTNLYAGLSSVATTDAGGYTEPSGGSYARFAIPCTTGQWNAPFAESSRRKVSNINPVTWPVATANWGTMTHVFLADAASGGNVWWHGPLGASVAVNTGNSYSMGAAQLKPSLGGAMTDYLADVLLNHIFRGSGFTLPTNLFAGLSTAATTAAGGYTELSGNSYARVQYACSAGNWAAPADSSGKRQTSNNNAITYPTASGNWAAASHFFFIDVLSGAGNVHWHGPLNSPVTVNNTQAFAIPAGSCTPSLT